MRTLNRRAWLMQLASAGLATSALAQSQRARRQPKAKASLPLTDYEPKSMLHVPVTRIERARFPVIDFHTHLSYIDDDRKPERNIRLATRAEILPVMERRNIRAMVSLTGGYGAVLAENIAYWQTPSPDRFLIFTEPTFNRAHEPGYAKFQADELARAKQAGAKGLKVLKTLGLFLREPRRKTLVTVDDARFDSMWEQAGALGLPVAIHTSDPEAFFFPTDKYNERYEELNAHPDWSFHGRDFPGNRALHEARNRVIARHPRTQFVYLHVGNAEDLTWVSEWLDKYPNASVEIGARIGELGRQPRAARKFFDQYQDRILFGTDATPNSKETPQQTFGDELYEIYFRFLETEDEYFDYAPAPIPPQGRWRIYGLGLPEPILRKVYYENAARLLGLGRIT